MGGQWFVEYKVPSGRRMEFAEELFSWLEEHGYEVNEPSHLLLVFGLVVTPIPSIAEYVSNLTNKYGGCANTAYAREEFNELLEKIVLLCPNDDEVNELVVKLAKRLESSPNIAPSIKQYFFLFGVNMEPDLELNRLGQFYGTQHYYNVLGSLVTDGIKYIMDNGYS